MAICVPIKDLRDTARFAELVESSSTPVTVTKNGYDQFVAMRSADYEELCQAEAKAKLLERIIIAERERRAGDAVDAFDSLKALRQRHGL